MTRRFHRKTKRGRPSLDHLWAAFRIRQAIADYARGDDSVKAIARKYAVDVKRLRRWADTAGCARPPRGRRRLTEPNAQQKALLSRLRFVPVKQLAEEARITTQYLYALAKRWPQSIRAQSSPGRHSVAGYPHSPPLPGPR